MKNYRLCKLYTAGGKLSKQWFVYYYYLNPRTALMERFRVFDGINIHRTAKLRRKAALELKEAIDKLLLQGWSPYLQEDQSDLVVPQLLGYTMAQLLDKFRQETEVFTRRQTQNSFSSTLNQYERWLKAHGWLQKYAQDFKRHHAQEYADYLVAKLHLTHTTRNNRIGHLKALYNRLIGKDPAIELNPFDRVKNLKREQSARNLAFTPADQRRISTWLQLQDPALHLFVQFMYYTFIRPYELVRLRVRHIDLESGRICIPGEISKNRKTLYVAIPDSFRPVLETSGIQEHPGHWFVFSEKLQPGPGYTDRQGDTLGIHRNRVSERHLRALKAVELQQVYSLYSWKHTGVCRAFRAGVDILDLKAQLRHHSLEETGVYLKSLGVEVSDRLRQGFPAF